MATQSHKRKETDHGPIPGLWPTEYTKHVEDQTIVAWFFPNPDMIEPQRHKDTEKAWRMPASVSL
jgi:hypothetical protein